MGSAHAACRSFGRLLGGCAEIPTVMPGLSHPGDSLPVRALGSGALYVVVGGGAELA
ncbi:hypothetical protein FB559_2874 [Actinoallomurus bryophytorum]|uniref:Uncharacterized protein n=1 Tax=Actinoallomurus bryophytorum TaxID=1490222 RepID=A0A543CJQ7_9ACTN|nr:hypothetical protein [Actinoallomurus bryophytorum]TQL97295.1 hypothetical protein FB559_2874 [Actinoallomurus bryophytorum]